ncbi:MAG: pirin family protein [Deltaproteobacteria bacterium]|nr:pirin family protein [Deltaproteobacteria bacterium]
MTHTTATEPHTAPAARPSGATLTDATSHARARTVALVHQATRPHWVGDGFLVSTYFPSRAVPAERVSPFLLMDYGPPRDFPPSTRGQRGVGWHPHRGFETVTIAWEGTVEHHDSTGGAGVIGPGDVQWMTAGRGILHEEHHGRDFSRTGGRMHMMQLWVNLPRASKMTEPGYQPITAREIPNVELPGGAGNARVIAGELDGVRGPARTFTPITMLDVRLSAGAPLSVALPSEHNAVVVVLSGSIAVADRRAGAAELVVFENDGARVAFEAVEDAHVLVLAGAPLGEPIVAHGPFVMTTEQEIDDAIRDFYAGKLGTV